jgi:hypothetical protein
MGMFKTWTMATAALAVIIISSVIGVAVFYSEPSKSSMTTTFSPQNSVSSDKSSTSSSNSSEVAWTLSDCGVHTITSTTTSTEYFANTTLTSTVYELTPIVIANNSAAYTTSNETYFTFTSYNATTTATTTTTQTSTYTTTQTYGCAVIHFQLYISYSGAWHGNYSYGCFCQGGTLTQINLNGSGSRNVDASFQGNFSDGLCFGGWIHKDDNSDNTLAVNWTSDAIGSYANSISIPKGIVQWSGCSID